MDFKKEKEFRIRPHSDIQWGHPDVDARLVQRLIDETASDDMCVSIGAGDLIDSDRPSTRIKKIIAFAGRESELSQDDMKKMSWLDKEVVPMWAKMAASKNWKRGFGLIGEIDGHHHELYRNGMTSTQYIMRQVRNKIKYDPKNPLCRYLGEMMCYVVLHVKDTRPKSQQSFTITIHLQHGVGGSQYIATDMTKLERQTTPYWEADIFLRGHSTKKYAAMRPMLYPSRSRINPELKEKTIVMANTGGYMKGYGPGPKPSYVEQFALAPVTLGHVVIRVRLRKDGKHNDNTYPEFSVEC